MYIVDYKRGEVVNIDNTASIYRDGKNIIAVTTVRDIILGSYESDNRVKEVFEEMLKWVFPPNMMVAHNCPSDEIMKIQEMMSEHNMPLILNTMGDARIERFDCGAYYMPQAESEE